jgi:hypothetical protein
LCLYRCSSNHEQHLNAKTVERAAGRGLRAAVPYKNNKLLAWHADSCFSLIGKMRRAISTVSYQAPSSSPGAGPQKALLSPAGAGEIASGYRAFLLPTLHRSRMTVSMSCHLGLISGSRRAHLPSHFLLLYNCHLCNIMQQSMVSHMMMHSSLCCLLELDNSRWERGEHYHMKARDHAVLVPGAENSLRPDGNPKSSKVWPCGRRSSVCMSVTTAACDVVGNCQ